MKNRFLTFIIGILIGSITMILVFLFFNKTVDDMDNNNFPGNGPMQRQNENINQLPRKTDENM